MEQFQLKEDVLSKGCAAYVAHSHIIDELLEQAGQLEMLDPAMRADVIRDDGIVCKTNDETHWSLSTLFAAWAEKILWPEEGTVYEADVLTTMKHTLWLLHRVLAAFVSVNQKPRDMARDSAGLAYEETGLLIDQLHEYCEEQGFAPLLPDLMNATRLKNRLVTDQSLAEDSPEVDEVFSRLAEIFCFESGRIEVIARVLREQGRYRQMTNLLETAAQASGLEKSAFMSKRSSLLEMYIVGLQSANKHQEISALCDAIPVDSLLKIPFVMAAYLHALVFSGRNDRLKTLLLDFDIKSKSPEVQKAKYLACKRLCMALFHCHEYKTVCILIEKHIDPDEWQTKGGFHRLYQGSLSQVKHPNSQQRRRTVK